MLILFGTISREDDLEKVQIDAARICVVQRC